LSSNPSTTKQGVKAIKKKSSTTENYQKEFKAAMIHVLKSFIEKVDNMNEQIGDLSSFHLWGKKTNK
jgi:hypothetical protein